MSARVPSPLHSYVAWLDGQSVARGTLADVERLARETFATPRYQEWRHGQPSTLRITRGPRQLFVKSIILQEVSS